MHQSALLA